jgi:hypothetical protein
LFDSPLVCKVVQTSGEFPLESKVYAYLKTLTRQDHWKFLRVDTTDQKGFPDILLLKQRTYWQIEAKLLKKKQLVSLEDDLHWQFGQVGYMKRALTLNLNYMLVVAKDTSIAFIKGDSNDRTKYVDYPHFVRCL